MLSTRTDAKVYTGVEGPGQPIRKDKKVLSSKDPKMRSVTQKLCALFVVMVLAVASIAQPVWADDPIRLAPEGQSYDEMWAGLSWGDMTDAEHQLWQVLGWTQDAWDGDDPSKHPASEQKSWSELTEQEKDAAVVLGYSELTWD